MKSLKWKLTTTIPAPTASKEDVSIDGIAPKILSLLDTIQQSLFDKAKAGRDAKLVQVTTWSDFVPALERGCLVLTPWCDDAEWEDKVKVRYCSCCHGFSVCCCY